MDQRNSGGQKGLIERVIDPGICVACGACVGLCPYFDYMDGRVVVMDRCQSDTWRCLQVCPRADYGEPSPERITDPADSDGSIGSFRKIIMARARSQEIRNRTQYGGAVSTLLIYAMEKGAIEAAVITDEGREMSPAGVVAHNPSNILDCAGSRYTASGGLAALNGAIRDGKDGLAVVGLPCQMEALVRLRAMEPDGPERSDRVRLRIGLFCTWALDFRRLRDYLQGLGMTEPIRKYDIPPPPAQVFRFLTDEGWREVSLDHIRPFILKGCSLCRDMTAEWSDISVGTAEGLEGWNTLVVRTEVGEELLNGAVRDDVLETDGLPGANLAHLKEASRNKRERGKLNRKALGRDQ
jgi:coenzyme F420 hydrogenase subunit beta